MSDGTVERFEGGRENIQPIIIGDERPTDLSTTSKRGRESESTFNESSKRFFRECKSRFGEDITLTFTNKRGEIVLDSRTTSPNCLDEISKLCTVERNCNQEVVDGNLGPGSTQTTITTTTTTNEKRVIEEEKSTTPPPPLLPSPPQLIVPVVVSPSELTFQERKLKEIKKIGETRAIEGLKRNWDWEHVIYGFKNKISSFNVGWICGYYHKKGLQYAVPQYHMRGDTLPLFERVVKFKVPQPEREKFDGFKRQFGVETDLGFHLQSFVKTIDGRIDDDDPPKNLLVVVEHDGDLNECGCSQSHYHFLVGIKKGDSMMRDRLLSKLVEVPSFMFVRYEREFSLEEMLVAFSSIGDRSLLGTTSNELLYTLKSMTLIHRRSPQTNHRVKFPKGQEEVDYHLESLQLGKSFYETVLE